MTKQQFLSANLEDSDTVTVSAKEYKALLIAASTESALSEELRAMTLKLDTANREATKLAKANMELRGRLPTYTIDEIV